MCYAQLRTKHVHRELEICFGKGGNLCKFCFLSSKSFFPITSTLSFLYIKFSFLFPGMLLRLEVPGKHFKASLGVLKFVVSLGSTECVK